MNKRSRKLAAEIQAAAEQQFPGAQVKVTAETGVIDWQFALKMGLRAGAAVAVSVLIYAVVHGLI